MRRIASLCVLLPILFFCLNACAQNSQSYLNDFGSTAYGINIPVENGFINISNGNLHLEFPLASHPQRGGLALSERITYDSRIWEFLPFGSHGSYHWWPYNVPGTTTTSAGWQFLTGAETGSFSYTAVPGGSSNPCFVPGDGNDTQSGTQYTTISALSWSEPSGTVHPFNATQTDYVDTCAGTSSQSISGGNATDGSGYSVADDGNGNPLVTDSNGTQVYPYIRDRYGNSWSLDGQGNLVDDTGRTPVIVTQSGNVTYYDVLAPNGPINNNGTRVRYTVTISSVPVATNFGQSDIYEWNPSVQYLTPVQSIQLPDGSQYSFSYDSYGGLSSMTLPTGGVVQYGYSNFIDSSNTANRWLTSRTVGSNPQMTFTPSVVTTCANYSTGCVEQVNVHKPSGDETVYTLTLNNGAWNTGTITYTGSASGGQQLIQVANANTYTNPCSNSSACVGANYISQSLSSTILYPSGGQPVYKQTQSIFDPLSGKPTAVKEWDYVQSASPNTVTPPSGNPTRETDYSYTSNAVGSATVYDPYQTQVYDSSHSLAGQTTYGYTTSATSTSGFTNHTAISGASYLNTVSHWLNAGSTSSSTTTYTMYDTGQVNTVQDPDSHPVTTYTYQCGGSLPNTVMNGLNQTTTYGFDCSSGQITSVKDPNNAQTSYAYEPGAGRLYTVTSADGGVVTYSYPSSTEVDTTITATPNPSITTASIVDSFGRPYQKTTSNISTETTYDVNGRVYCITNPHIAGQSNSTDGSTCISSYDGLDRPLTQQLPDSNTRTWSYSANTTTSTNERNISWVRTSDAFGRLTTVSEPAPSGAIQTSYVYDGLGNVQAITQSGNTASGDTARVRTFTYDSMSRLICASHPEGSSSSCPTSATSTLPSGVMTYTYDAVGNVRTKTSPLANASSGTQTINYSYDALNRLAQKSYPVLPVASTPKYSYSCYQYDTTSTTGASSTGNFIGRLTNSWTQISSSSSFTCPSSPPSAALSRHSILAYDSMGRLKSDQQCTAASCGGIVYTPTYTYDLAGNLNTHSSGMPSGAGSFTFTNGYDAAGRLTSVTSSNTQYPTSLFTVPSSSAAAGCNASGSSPGYSAAGGLQNAILGVGLQLTRSYDSRLRISCESDIGNSTLNPTPGTAKIVINGTDQP